jgi:hypothetical protein
VGALCFFEGQGGGVLLKGLYKFAFKTARGAGCGVMFATESGKLYGGNSGSSFIGSYSADGEEIVSEMMMSRHNHDPAYAPMYPVDNVVMTFRGGHEVGIGFSGTYDSDGAEGDATALAGKRSIRFKAVLRKLVEA